jgi:hypothetical protein
VNSAFVDYYRCPESYAPFVPSEASCQGSGYFRFGSDVICYGHCYGGRPAKRNTDELFEAMKGVTAVENKLLLPFNPSEIATNLRYERYISPEDGESISGTLIQNTYYLVRPLLHVPVRKHLQRLRLRDAQKIGFPNWPVDRTIERMFERLMALLLETTVNVKIPFIWFWPNGAPSCTVITHDIETAKGRDFCSGLMDLDEAHGISSSFFIIPEDRYRVTPSFLDLLRRRGFEVGVHDLNHDGRLLRGRKRFLARAERINRYGQEFGASGFRAGGLYHNLDWFSALKFSYDMSVPSVGHLEAQRGGCCSVMPFFVGDLLEIPVTTTQDYSLFHILNNYSIDLWKREIAGIIENHGLCTFIAHPDYLIAARAQATYRSLLAYLSRLCGEGKTWLARAGEVDEWWRARNQMKLVPKGDGWEIQGPQSHKARLAYAVLDDGRLIYQLEPQSKIATLSSAEEQLSDISSGRMPQACVEVTKQ